MQPGQICLHAFIFAPRQIGLCRNRVFVNRDIADDPVSRKSTTGLVAQIGDHTVKSWSTLQSFDSPERRRSGVLRSGEKRSSWTILGIRSHGSGNSMKVEIQSDSSTANYTVIHCTFGHKNEYKVEWRSQ